MVDRYLGAYYSFLFFYMFESFHNKIITLQIKLKSPLIPPRGPNPNPRILLI